MEKSHSKFQSIRTTGATELETKNIMSLLPESEVFIKTIFGEARSESELGQTWIGWVIKNRSHSRRETIKQVCLARNQFECWSGRNNVEIKKNEEEKYTKIAKLAQQIYKAPMSDDPTDGCQHFNNPNKQYAEWTTRTTKKKSIGKHEFYWFDQNTPK